MQLDKYSNPIFNEHDLFDALYKGHRFSADDTMLVERTASVKELEKQIGFELFLRTKHTLNLLTTIRLANLIGTCLTSTKH